MTGPTKNYTGISVTNNIQLVTDTETQTYPNTTQGLRDAVAACSGGEQIKLPEASYDIATTGIELPNKVSLVGSGKRSTIINADDGIGSAIIPDGESRLENFSLLGDGAGTADDIGINPVSNTGFVTGYNLEVSSFWKNLYLDAHFNSRWVNCQFDSSRTGQTQGASVHAETASGSNNDTRFVSCFFGLNETRMAWIEANQVTFVAPHGEGNSGDRLYQHDFGDGFSIVGGVHHAEQVSDRAVLSTAGSGHVQFNELTHSGGGGEAFRVTSDLRVSYDGPVTGWSTIESVDSGAPRTVNRVGEETANAEEPQDDWFIGDRVNFTDSGDGSGTGVYLFIAPNTPVQID